jgi:hypothetical protein
MARRQRYQRVLLPGEKEGRRDFIKKGLLGGLILAVGGGTWLFTRRTRAQRSLEGPFQVLSVEEATVVLAVANRLIPERVGFPRPLDVGVPRKVDAILAMAHPATQKEARQLVRLFENALTGLVFEAQLRTFTSSSPEEQDERLRGWATSRITLRRTGYRALKRLVYAAYYASPETWPVVGYAGPPDLPSQPPGRRPEAEKPEAGARPAQPQRAQEVPAEAARPAPRPARTLRQPEGPAEAARPPPRPAEPEARPIEPAPIEQVPAPRTGMELREEER